jgi:hypothetical protein
MQASKSRESKKVSTVTLPDQLSDNEELTSPVNLQELKIFGEEYRIEEVNIHDNSLVFSTTSSASYYVLQILDKKSTNILSKIKHENIAKVIVSGNDNDLEISYRKAIKADNGEVYYESFDVKPGQTFFVREFVTGEIASQYFGMEIIRPEGRTNKLTRVRVESLFLLIDVIIDVLISSNQSIAIRLSDIVISTTSNLVKIVNIHRGMKKDKPLVVLLDNAIDVFQALLESKDGEQIVLTSEDIDEIDGAKNAAIQMKEIVLTKELSLEDIKSECKKLYELLKDEAKNKHVKNEEKVSIVTGTNEIIKILYAEKKSDLSSQAQNAKIGDIIGAVSAEQKAKIGGIIESISAVSIATKNIKRAFVQTFDMAIDSLANNRELSLSWPFSKDDLWHATILIRRPKETASLPCDDAIGCLTPVLMRTYKNNLKYASSDWISNEVNLVAINASCAGIPIKWYSRNGREDVKNAINNVFVIRFSDGTYASSSDEMPERSFAQPNNADFSTKQSTAKSAFQPITLTSQTSSNSEMIRFVVVKELNKILHPESPESENKNPFVRDTYASAEEVGWEMVTEIGTKSSIDTKKLQYLISIPFYTPFTNTVENINKKNIGDKIIAVAHFEIEQIFVEGMIEKIAEKLAYFIQDKNCFGLNDFHSVILKDVDVRDC